MQTKKKVKNVNTILPLLFIGLWLVQSDSAMDPALTPRFIYLGLIITLSFITLYKNISKYGSTLLRHPLTIACFIFITISSFSIFYAHIWQEGLFFTLKTCATFLFAFVIATSLKETNLKLWFVSTLISQIILSFWVLAQILELQVIWPLSLETTYYITAGLGHKNILAAALTILTLLNFYGLFITPRKLKPLIILVLFIGIGIILSLKSRASLLAFISAVTTGSVLGVVYLRFNFKKVVLTKKLILLITFSVFACFSAIYFNSSINTKLQEALPTLNSNTQRTYTIKERSLLWKHSIEMSLNESFLGIGAGNWKVHFPQYGSGIWRARQGMVQFQRPHNDLLWILCELGVLGLCTYLLLTLMVYHLALKTLSNPAIKTFKKIYTLAAVSAFTAYQVISLFSFPLERIALQCLWALSVGIIVSDYLKINTNKKVKSLQILGCLIGLTVIFVGFIRYTGEVWTKQAEAYRKNSQWREIDSHPIPPMVSIFYKVDPVSLPTQFYSGLAALNLRDLDRATSIFEEGIQVHPNNIHLINNLASVYQLSGKDDKSLQFYKKAVQIAPFYQDGILNLTSLQFNTNHVEEAYTTLVKHATKFESNRSTYNQYLFTIIDVLIKNWEDEMGVNNRNYSSDYMLKMHEESLSNNKKLHSVWLEQL